MAWHDKNKKSKKEIKIKVGLPHFRHLQQRQCWLIARIRVFGIRYSEILNFSPFENFATKKRNVIVGKKIYVHVSRKKNCKFLSRGDQVEVVLRVFVVL